MWHAKKLGYPATLRDEFHQDVVRYGRALPLEAETPEFEAAWEAYLDRFPAAAGRIALPDFILFRLDISSARFVGGFARAATLRAEELRRAAG